MSKTLATSKIVSQQPQSNIVSARSIGGVAILEEEEHEEAFHTSSSGEEEDEHQLTHEYNFDDECSEQEQDEEETHITHINNGNGSNNHNGYEFSNHEQSINKSDTIDDLKYASQSFSQSNNMNTVSFDATGSGYNIKDLIQQ